MASLPVSGIPGLLGGRPFELPSDAHASGVQFDSRKIRPGDIFVAIAGAQGDGHDFISKAFAAGAVLAVVSNESKADGYPGVLVSDPRKSLSRLAALFAARPADRLKVIAVTGTNGKTTTNWLVYHALNALRQPCIRIGTLGVEAGNLFSRPGNLTTPDPVEIQNDLRAALDGGCTAAVMETSSHALAQGRVDDIAFDVGIFTNLTRDHLDYHGSMDEYFRAKRRLFELISEGKKETRAAVINIDTDAGRKLQAELPALALRDFSFGTAPGARIRIASFTQNLAGSLTDLNIEGRTYALRTKLLGSHNAQNLAGALGALMALGIPVADACAALEVSPQVPGRLEAITGAPFGVFVDYAHTPDALENVLPALRSLVKGSLWVVFGCGGDRDRGKRPQMAEVAQRLGDRVVVTSDNPRTEDPQRIIQDILSQGAKVYMVEADRRIAITETLRQAKAGDCVLIAGKGHEDYQIVGTEKSHFSDQEVARETLKALGYTR